MKAVLRVRGPTAKWPGEVVCDEENIIRDVDNAVIVGDAIDKRLRTGLRTGLRTEPDVEMML